MDDFNNNQPQGPQDNHQPQDQQQDQYAQQGYQPQQQDPYAQPTYYQQPDQSAYYPQPEQKGGAGMAIASMVLGILSIALFCIWFLALPMAIISIVLGIISLYKKKPGKGMAIAGIICSGVGIVVCVIILIIAAGIAGNPEYSSPDFWSSFIEENQ